MVFEVFDYCKYVDIGIYKLMGPHTNLFSRAHYLFEEINQII